MKQVFGRPSARATSSGARAQWPEKRPSRLLIMSKTNFFTNYQRSVVYSRVRIFSAVFQSSAETSQAISSFFRPPLYRSRSLGVSVRYSCSPAPVTRCRSVFFFILYRRAPTTRRIRFFPFPRDSHNSAVRTYFLHTRTHARTHP